MTDIITINGIEYAPVSAQPSGTRAVVVVDRGWIFAGNVTRENGRIRISDALHVFKWEANGFSGMIEDPTYVRSLTLICLAVQKCFAFRCPTNGGANV